MNKAERITQGIDNWLRDEARESRVGRNKVLDDFTGFRASFLSMRGNSRNLDAQKMSGHRTRFNLLANMIDERLLTDNYIAGKLIHHSLMFVSGGFRVQSYLQASSQTEYEALRFDHLEEPNGATGVPIGMSVTRGLGHTASLMAWDEIDYGLVRAASIGLNEEIYEKRCGIYDWFHAHPERAADSLGLAEDPVQAVLRCQQAGIELATIHIAVAAKLRGDDLGRVPFLEPKSISDVSPEPIYPLAN